MEYKSCSICKELKSVDNFFKNKLHKSGYQSACKLCRRVAFEKSSDKTKEYKAKHYQENKEKILADCKEHRLQNIERIRAFDRGRYIRDRERRIAYAVQYQKDFPEVNKLARKKYARANPDVKAKTTATRRARKENAIPCWARDEWDKFLISEIYNLSKLRTAMLKIRFEVDHVIPLVSDKVCGLHCASNLEILTAYDNNSKGNRWWPDMW